MKLFFRIIFNISLLITILVGCATTEEIKETDPVALLNQGRALLKEGQHDRAIACFNKAIEINPVYAKAYNNRGIAYAKSKDQHNKAISDFNKVIEINPRDADAYINRGIIYMVGIGNKNKACSDLKRACELRLCKAYEFAKGKGDCK